MSERTQTTEKKKMGRPPTSTRKDVVVRFDQRLAIKARWVASNRGVSLAEYLSEAARAVIERDHREGGKTLGT